MTITYLLDRIKEAIPVEWDRFTECEGFYVIYGWITRSDAQRDFLMISLYDGDYMDDVFYATSSAKYSKEISTVLYCSSEDHVSCQKVEELYKIL